MKKHYGLINILLMLCIVLVSAGASIADNTSAQVLAPVFSFAVFGDTQPASENGGQPDVFRSILKRMNDFNPAFAVSTGDRIYGSSSLAQVQAQYQDFTTLVKSILPCTVYQAIGNHEIQSNKTNEDFFAKEMGGPYYSFDRGDSHFIVLDSEYIGQAARITGEQLEWLKQDLHKSRSARHKFVFLHRPLYPVDGHMGECMDMYPKDRDALHSLFVRNRITAVFSGHEHLFNRQKRNGVTYIISGGGGGFVFPSIDGKGDYHHFVVVSIAGDKVEMTLVKIAENGRPEEVLPINDDFQQ